MFAAFPLKPRQPRFVNGVGTSVPCHGARYRHAEYYGRRRVRGFLALTRVVFFVPELARVARCEVSVFVAGFVFLAGILLPFFALDCWDRFGTAETGVEI